MKQYPKYKDSKIPWIGDVPEHWKTKRLEEDAAFLPGMAGAIMLLEVSIMTSR